MENKKKFLIDFSYLVSWILIIYVSFRYMLPIFLPFIFGFMFSVAARKITKNQNMIVLIGMYVICGILLVFLVIWIVNIIGGYISGIPTLYRNTIEPFINDVYDAFVALNKRIDFPYLNEILSSGFTAIRNVLLSVGSKAASAISKGLLEIPSIIVSLLIFIISSFFFTADYDHVIAFAEKHFSMPLHFIREKLWAVLTGYGKIIGITFVELTIGLLLIGIPNFVLVAAGIAVLDILPVLGCGTVLVPWILITLVQRNFGRGFSLLALHVIIYMVRQYIEPKIVASKLEIPPIISLMSMAIGLKLFGFVGVMGMPLVASYYLYSHPEIMKTEDE